MKKAPRLGELFCSGILFRTVAGDEHSVLAAGGAGVQGQVIGIFRQIRGLLGIDGPHLLDRIFQDVAGHIRKPDPLPALIVPQRAKVAGVIVGGNDRVVGIDGTDLQAGLCVCVCVCI